MFTVNTGLWSCGDRMALTDSSSFWDRSVICRCFCHFNTRLPRFRHLTRQKKERVRQCGQIISSNLHNLMVTMSSLLCWCHSSPFGHSVYLCFCLISVALQANKLVLESSSGTWAASVGHTQEVVGDQQTVFPLPVYVLPPSLPACLPFGY